MCFLAGPYIFSHSFPKRVGSPPPRYRCCLDLRSIRSCSPRRWRSEIKILGLFGSRPPWRPPWKKWRMENSHKMINVPKKWRRNLSYSLHPFFSGDMISWLQKFKPFESGLHHLHPIFLEIFYLLLWWLVTSTHERICRVSFASQIGACSKSEIRKLIGVCDL